MITKFNRRARALALMLAILTIFSIVSIMPTQAEAASSWPSLSKSAYCEFTAIKTINVYKNTSCTTRGTSDPVKSYNAYISSGDVCYIYKITSDYLQVNYPTSSGRRTGYIKRSDLISKSAPVFNSTSTGSAVTYTKAGGAKYGSIAKSDKIYKCGTSGSYTQIIYTAKSGSRAYKLGWLTTSDYNKYCYTQISVSPTSVNFTSKGATKKITATVTNGSGTTTWTSSDKSVATVSGSGNTATITAVGTAGATKSCTITASNNGTTAKVTVKVVRGTDISVSPTSATLTGKGATKKFTATVTNGSGTTTWTSSNTSVAKVSGSGNTATVTAVGSGSCYIYAKNNGKTSNKVTVTVNENVIVTQAEIDSAAKKYGISTSSNAYKALLSINSKYAKNSSLSSSDKKGRLVFMFEGVGSNSSTDKRSNAMCVVIVNGKIEYISLNCSTLPDHPFHPKYNKGDPVPTLRAGVFKFVTTNHSSKTYGNYAALKVKGTTTANYAPVVRFESKTDWYLTTRDTINVHARGNSNVGTSLSPWSAGCQNILASDYLKFCKAVGILNSSATTFTKNKYDNYITGKIIIDRSYAKSYLTNIGYPSDSLKYLM